MLQDSDESNMLTVNGRRPRLPHVVWLNLLRCEQYERVILYTVLFWKRLRLRRNRIHHPYAQASTTLIGRTWLTFGRMLLRQPTSCSIDNAK